MWQALGPQLRDVRARRVLARPSPVFPDLNEVPIVVVGLFRTANGIGEAARLTFQALEAAGYKPLAVDVSEVLASVDIDPGFTLSAMPDDRTGLLILQLNAPEIASALHHIGFDRSRAWYTIGYWAWELPGFPKGWQRAFCFLSEVWAISSFTAKALMAHPKMGRVQALNHAVLPPDEVKADRSKFDLPEEAFVTLAMADSLSSFMRKNPFDAIAAHRAAFGGNEEHILVLKTRNLSRHQQAEDDLRKAVAHSPNIRILDEALSADDRWNLLATCDVLLSLHRAEGFGLTIAEAMAIGKPCVITDWSGSQDFTSDQTAILVPATPVPVDDPYGIYEGKGQEWAQPSVQAAAEGLIRLAASPNDRHRIGAAGQSFVKQCLSPARIGAEMRMLFEARRRETLEQDRVAFWPEG
jgi:glycosyltransferase involved in cell wall biosynthesis